MEAEYLAAQIARISHGATLTVEGLYFEQTDEVTEAVTIVKKTGAAGEEPFEVKPSGPDGLSGEETFKTMWVHHPLYPSILAKMGRCTWPVKPLAEGEEEPPEDEEKEEGEPNFKTLEEESPIGSVPAFSARLATPVLGNFSPAVISSNRWIGSHAIALESKCVNVYVGNGVKYTGSAAFQVAMPPALPAECSELLPGEEGSEEPGAPRPGMSEAVDEPMPDPFLVVDGTAEEGEGEEETG